ncbi:hypothetical protein O181_061479 [Austropuccinia psidii MF-1]|uniref:Uncharacterized protein n=1 Tax=Austropuccinia psidii MF-1 TaxID=1389203 RepID=A0A9Q3EIG2_9BASI|nr:hypothetical protein [Austropuccinia psidii MF-1]
MGESPSDLSISESSMEIDTSPVPRGLITKEPFKGPEEVEVTTPSNKMNLDQEIQVINPKDKNVSLEERHKWRIPELQTVPKGNSGNIPVSVQGLAYGRKTHGVGTFSRPLDTDNELLYSSKEALGPRNDREPSEGLDTHVLQRKSPKGK